MATAQDAPIASAQQPAQPPEKERTQPARRFFRREPIVFGAQDVRFPAALENQHQELNDQLEVDIAHVIPIMIEVGVRQLKDIPKTFQQQVAHDEAGRPDGAPVLNDCQPDQANGCDQGSTARREMKPFRMFKPCRTPVRYNRGEPTGYQQWEKRSYNLLVHDVKVSGGMSPKNASRNQKGGCTRVWQQRANSALL